MGRANRIRTSSTRRVSGVLDARRASLDGAATEVDASLFGDGGRHLFKRLEGRKGHDQMAAERNYSLSTSAVNAVVESAEKIEGAASLLLLLEEKAGGDGVVTPPELAAIRGVLESCAKDLNGAFQEV